MKQDCFNNHAMIYNTCVMGTTLSTSVCLKISIKSKQRKCCEMLFYCRSLPYTKSFKDSLLPTKQRTSARLISQIFHPVFYIGLKHCNISPLIFASISKWNAFSLSFQPSKFYPSFSACFR